MARGTTIVNGGIAVWLGPLPAIALASLYPAAITPYTRLVKETEL
jgi:hypothetical protein